ncbi:MAG: 1,4-alpha-glucan branching protein GlgB [Clostridium sp.]|nr:1,4-alpha-glucan branching protein GlgB [Clostridium sp.]
MDKTLYDLMDWAGIEEIVYSEAANPHNMLGAHMTDEGMLVQAFIPTARDITVKITSTGKQYQMEMADEAGFFAALIPRKTLADYTLLVFYDNGTLSEIHDPYSFAPQLTEADLKKFGAGIHYSIYEKMGAHPMTIKGMDGVYFAVWAPCAMRVSVVGEFNFWDGRLHQMRKLGDSGIFEIFIPGVKKGALYKYEIKFKNGDPALKADPYANYAELRPNTASVVWELNQFTWTDDEWMKKRATRDTKAEPMSIYEVHLGSWKRKELELDENGAAIVGSEFYNYREIAVELATYVKEMGYTHVELMPVMEHPLDASWGYQTTGYYAPTSRFGTPDEFRAFVDRMHREGIGVILDWDPAHFPKDAHGLAAFDGTCLYEHADPRQGEQPKWGMLNFNYGRPQVSNFLISNALYWAEQFHVDGIRANAVASMLYLDYGKNAGEWIANLYGGHENLEAVEFLKHLNSIFHREVKGAVMIAEESTAWPRVTGDLNEEGLGFDYKWNSGWTNDFLRYMRCEPHNRQSSYGDLTFSMLYAYSEDFIQAFSHDEVTAGKGSMMGKMPGETKVEKLANLRAAYGFQMGHPGKKLLFMGQEFAQNSEWSEAEGLHWNILEEQEHQQMQAYVKAWNHLYRSEPALYEQDYEPAGFEWINCTCDKENIVLFQRRGRREEDVLVFVCNFASNAYDAFRVGVPRAGIYEEVLNSDAKAFGGSGKTNPEAVPSEPVEKDGRDNSIVIRLAPMSVCVFRYVPETAAGEKMAGLLTNEKEEKSGEEMTRKSVLPAIHPAKTAKAAGEAIAQKGADALDRLSETVGKIMNKKK